MPQAPKQSVNLPFPVGGIVDGSAHTDQPENTTHDAKNVLPFDTSEKRMRGGRRRGIKKTTGTSLGNSRIQHLISSDIVSTTGELSSGSVMRYRDDHPDVDIRGELVHLDYSILPDGTQLDEDTLGYTFYGKGCTSARKVGSDVHLIDYDENKFSHVSFGFNVLMGLGSGADLERSQPIILGSGLNTSFKGLTKQSDEGGSYILVDPSAFEFAQANSLGGRHSGKSWDSRRLFEGVGNNAMVNPSNHFRQNGDAVTIWKTCLLLPEHEFDNKPWNSSPTKAYCTRMEFQLPTGPAHTFPGGTVIFVGSAEDEETEPNAENKIYDPYFLDITNGAGTDTYGTFDAFEYYTEAVGLIFRVGADFEKVRVGPSRSDWCYDFYKNGKEVSEEKAAFAIYFRRTNSSSDDGNIAGIGWDLYGSPGLWHQGSSAHSGFGGTGGDGESVLIKENAIPGNDTAYHVLEVRANENRLDIYIDGLLVKHYEDVILNFPYLATEAGTDLTDSFGYGGLFSYHANTVKRLSNSGHNTTTKNQLAYFCSYDWATRSSTEDDTLNQTVETEHTDTRKGSKSWRIRNIEWREVNLNDSSTRVVLAISNGKIYESENGGSFSLVSTSTALDAAARVVDGVSYFQNIYFVDGRNYRKYDPGSNTTADWDATGDPTLPGGDGITGLHGLGTYDENTRCSIIEIFNGRIVMAGKADEANNWFMSAIGDPLDWDINTSILEGGAVTGSGSSIGESSENITAFAPMTDDRLLIGGSNNIHMLTGDPSSLATQLVSVSRDIGIIGQNAWCYGPNKSVYFMGENGLYNLQPNDFDVAQSNRVSLGKMDTTFTNIDFSANHCRLVYDHSLYGVHIFLTPHTRNSNALQNFFYDTRSNSFWEMEIPSIIGPTAAVDFQDLDPSARKILLGGYDGHIRTFDQSALDDDGTAIDSYVWIGPLQLGRDREIKITELIAILDEQTGYLGYEIYAADTVEAAKVSTPIVTGQWSNGRNGSTRVRVRGSAIFLRLNSDAVATPWALENLTATLAAAGRVRQR